MLSSCCDPKVTFTERDDEYVITIDGTPNFMPRFYDCNNEALSGGSQLVTCDWLEQRLAATELYITNVTRAGNQITITRSDGQTWSVNDVNVASFAIVGGALRITETDGTTHDVAVPAGWSDVFVSYIGDTITFADGDTVDLGNLNESLVRQPNGSFNLVDSAGNVSGNVPLWIANTLPSGVATTDFGLGSIVNAIDTAAMTEAEVLSAPADLAATSVGMMRHVLTNRAIEGGAAGMRNDDGSLGAYSKSYTSIDAAVNNGNFAAAGVTVANGSTPVINGKYNGQLLLLLCSGNGEQALTGSFRGVLRDSQHRIKSHTVINSIIVRPTEVLFFRWVTDRWVALSFNYELLSGAGWMETAAGEVDLDFTFSESTPIPVGENLTYDVDLPVKLAGGQYMFSANNRNVTVPKSLGLASNATDDVHDITFRHTATIGITDKARFTCFNNTSTAISGMGTVYYHGNGVLDYADLGGIASY